MCWPIFGNARLVPTTCALAPFDIAKAEWCAFHSATVGHALVCMRTAASVLIFPGCNTVLALLLWGRLLFQLDL